MFLIILHANIKTFDFNVYNYCITIKPKKKSLGRTIKNKDRAYVFEKSCAFSAYFESEFLYLSFIRLF